MDFRNSSILVVDDDTLIRELLSTWLKHREYGVKTAKNGQQALDLIQKHNFDLILLDIMMPDMDGFDVLKALKDMGNSTPVVVMSALTDLKSVVRCIQLGAEDFLSKPIESELLWARLNASLEKKHFRDAQQTWLEELKLLQEIDQELNTTLDREAISWLTLHWGTEKTAALASCIGAIDGNQLHVRAMQGIEAADLPTLTADKQLREVTQTLVPANGRLHPEAKYRLTLPIHRNAIIRDVAIFDLAAPVSETTMRFLKRLAIHIAIAMHNAQLYADVQAANKAKSNFVAMVSHELKNPLTSIQSYTYLLSRHGAKLPAETQANYLSIITEGATRIHNLALELDDITQIETGLFGLKIEAVSLPDVVLNVVKMFGPQIEDKHQELILDLPEALPLVQADAKRLSQILTNLISNASKYTLENGRIHVSAQLVETDAGRQLQIAVKDSGIGIQPEDQGRIFSQFFRADDEKVANVRGTGLGLNITKKLVELQGGEIGFTSEYGHGSTFFFTLPVIEQETAVTARAQPVA
ncbi:MAG: response regulator [Anaerolineales bacterium]|nr:response regulator [Anaerolineales bacterium]